MLALLLSLSVLSNALRVDLLPIPWQRNADSPGDQEDLHTSLLFRIMEGEAEEALSLIDQGADTTFVFRNSMNHLMFAAAAGCASLIQPLSSRDDDCDTLYLRDPANVPARCMQYRRDIYGRNLLHHAMLSNDGPTFVACYRLVPFMIRQENNYEITPLEMVMKSSYAPSLLVSIMTEVPDLPGADDKTIEDVIRRSVALSLLALSLPGQHGSLDAALWPIIQIRDLNLCFLFHIRPAIAENQLFGEEPLLERYAKDGVWKTSRLAREKPQFRPVLESCLSGGLRYNEGYHVVLPYLITSENTLAPSFFASVFSQSILGRNNADLLAVLRPVSVDGFLRRDNLRSAVDYISLEGQQSGMISAILQISACKCGDLEARDAVRRWPKSLEENAVQQNALDQLSYRSTRVCVGIVVNPLELESSAFGCPQAPEGALPNLFGEEWTEEQRTTFTQYCATSFINHIRHSPDSSERQLMQRRLEDLHRECSIPLDSLLEAMTPLTHELLEFQPGPRRDQWQRVVDAVTGILQSTSPALAEASLEACIVNKIEAEDNSEVLFRLLQRTLHLRMDKALDALLQKNAGRRDHGDIITKCRLVGPGSVNLMIKQGYVFTIHDAFECLVSKRVNDIVAMTILGSSMHEATSDERMQMAHSILEEYADRSRFIHRSEDMCFAQRNTAHMFQLILQGQKMDCSETRFTSHLIRQVEPLLHFCESVPKESIGWACKQQASKSVLETLIGLGASSTAAFDGKNPMCWLMFTAREETETVRKAKCLLDHTAEGEDARCSDTDLAQRIAREGFHELHSTRYFTKLDDGEA